MNSAEHCLRIRHPEESQILMKRFCIKLRLNLVYFKQCFDLRSESQTVS